MSSTTIAVFDIAATRPCRSVAVGHGAASVPPVCVFSVIVSRTSTADEVVENDGRRRVPVAPDVKRLLYHARAAGMSDVRTRRSLSRRLASKSVAGARSVVLFALGSALNIGATASVRDCSGVVTVDTPDVVNETVALLANPKSPLNGTRAYSPAEVADKKTQPPLIAGRTSPTARVTGLDELQREGVGSVPLLQPEMTANSPIAIGTNAPRVRGASMDYSWCRDTRRTIQAASRKWRWARSIRPSFTRIAT